MKHLEGLIPKPATSISNGKHQLLIRTLQAPCVIGGANVDTYFRDTFSTRFNQA